MLATIITAVAAFITFFFITRKPEQFNKEDFKKDNKLSNDIQNNNNVINLEQHKINELNKQHQYTLNNGELTPTEVESFWAKKDDKKD